MKFLCDRCKTRYAIADERVRGKILKIRCKNCSAVITVREGMDEPESPALAAPPPGPPPPAALEEEWYVSRDGAQEGPFALTEAQAWIAARGADDDLFCWNEGFDDWLPVEKVSHFRGLRGAPARVRAPTRPGLPVEPEPPPLFAATMKAIEAEVAADAAKHPPTMSQLPAAKTAPASQWTAPATPVVPARAATPAVGGPALSRAATPAVGVPKLEPALGLPKLEPASPQPPPRPTQASPFGLAPSVAVHNPMKAAVASTPTALAAAAIAAPASRAPTPVPIAAAPIAAAPIAAAPIAAAPIAAAPMAPASPASRPAAARFDVGGETGTNAAIIDDEPAPPPPLPEPDFGDDDLDIGEVSRVVRLADLGRAAPSGRAQAAKPRTPTASVSAIGRGTGAVAALPLSAPSPELPRMDLDADAPMPPPPAPRRRSPVLYLGLGLAAVAAAAVAVVVLSGGDNATEGNETTGGTADYGDLGYRPSDPTSKRPDPIGSGVGTGTGAVKPDRPIGSGRKPVGSQTGTGTGTGSGSGPGTGTGPVETIGNPSLPDLSADDVFAMSSRMESGTRRCYERAMKEDPFLKVSKIKATISVSAAGPVSSVSLSTMANTPIGTCLTAAIKRWPFKPSKDGIVSEFALVFEQK